MNSETFPHSSSSEHALQRDLETAVSDTRRRQLDIFRQRQSETDTEFPAYGSFEGGSHS